MANEYRRIVDGFFGTLNVGCTALETSLQSSDFARLDAEFAEDQYAALILANDEQMIYETVFVRGHTAGSTTATVLRGQEGTQAREWPVGTVLRCAPTGRDGTQALSAAGIRNLVNPHVGMDVVERDTGLSKRRTLAQGFQASAAFGHLASRRVDAYGTVIPLDRVPILVAGHVDQNTTAGTGNSAISPGAGAVFMDMIPPPGNIISVLTTKLFPTQTDGSFSAAHMWGVERSTSNWRLWFAAVDGNNALLPAGRRVKFSVLVVAY